MWLAQLRTVSVWATQSINRARRIVLVQRCTPRTFEISRWPSTHQNLIQCQFPCPRQQGVCRLTPPLINHEYGCYCPLLSGTSDRARWGLGDGIPNSGHLAWPRSSFQQVHLQGWVVRKGSSVWLFPGNICRTSRMMEALPASAFCGLPAGRGATLGLAPLK